MPINANQIQPLVEVLRLASPLPKIKGQELKAKSQRPDFGFFGNPGISGNRSLTRSRAIT